MKINYYLDRKYLNKKGEAMIFFSLILDKQRLRIYTKERINPNDWDNVRNEVKNTVAGYEDINDLLRSWEEEAKRVYRQHRNLHNRPPSFEYMKSNLSFTKDRSSGFLDTWDKFVNSQGKLRSWTASTVKRYNTTRSQLKKLNDKHEITFDTINKDFLVRFLDHHYEQGFYNTYTKKNYKQLKEFLEWSAKEGYNKNLEYKNFEISLPEPSEHDNIYYLTIDELTRVMGLKMANEGEERAKDCFLFQCFTGLRYSDLFKLKKTDINKTEITVTTQKTRRRIKIPLNQNAKAIANRYKDLLGPNALPVITNQKYNEHLKEIGKAAELFDDVTWINYRGSERVEDTHPKWTKLTTHTGRKTFITLGVFLGISPETMIEYTGQTLDIIKRYYEIQDKTKEREMRKFNKLKIVS